MEAHNPLEISDSVECTSNCPPPQSKEAGVFVTCSIGRCGLLLVGTALPRTSRLLPALAELYLDRLEVVGSRNIQMVNAKEM